MTGRFITGPIVRDLQAAEDIGDRARLGWFDKEFNFFGTAYEKNGEKQYLISANEARIYDFMKEKLGEDIFCTPIEKYVKKCAVPSGTEDSMAMELKIILGKKIQKRYPLEFLKSFHESFQTVCADIAKDILNEFKEYIDGLFEEELLELFQILVEQAYGEKKLTRYAYLEFKDWILDVYADMHDDLIVKDIYRKDFYCLRYKEGDHWTNKIDAQKGHLYRQRDELISRNISVLPIYGKTYWYNTDYRLSDVRKDFKEHLESEKMQNFFTIADEIQQLPSAINYEEYITQCKIYRQQYGERINDYLKYYGTMWGCFQGVESM